MSEPRSRRILLIDDETGDARLMQVALQKCGVPITVESALDGHAALNILRRPAPAESPLIASSASSADSSAQTSRPDLILLDLKMPGQNGLDFLTEMKRDKALCGIPVVVVTTSTLESDVSASYRCGAAGFLAKPADVTEFIAAIRRLCFYWFTLVRLPDVAP